jgi:hypothetical protein
MFFILTAGDKNMNTISLTPTARRALMLALLSTLPAIALADVRYTSVSSMEREGAMKPISTMTTSLKEGLSRLDTNRHGLLPLRRNHHFQSGEPPTHQLRSKPHNLHCRTARRCCGRQSRCGAHQTSTRAEKSGVGKIVMTLAAKYLAWKSCSAMTRALSDLDANGDFGCCGIGNKGSNRSLDRRHQITGRGRRSADWKSSYASAYGRNDCRVTTETKGD